MIQDVGHVSLYGRVGFHFLESKSLARSEPAGNEKRDTAGIMIRVDDSLLCRMAAGYSKFRTRGKEDGAALSFAVHAALAGIISPLLHKDKFLSISRPRQQ